MRVHERDIMTSKSVPLYFISWDRYTFEQNITWKGTVLLQPHLLGFDTARAYANLSSDHIFVHGFVDHYFFLF